MNSQNLIPNPQLTKFAAATVLILILSACASPQQNSEPQATVPAPEVLKLEAQLAARSKSKVSGTVSIENASDHSVVKYEISGLKKNSKHGFHIHEKGDCSAPDATSAGGHWNPDGTSHGDLHAATRHAGDFGNITANAKGVAKGEMKVPTVNLKAAQGLAVIVHAKADDLKSQPAGNAGDRIGCGILN